MGWKDDLYGLGETTHDLQTRVCKMEQRQAAMNTKLDLMHRLIQDQVSKMADRVLEMAMIQQGGRRDANIHRQVAAQADQMPPSGDIWGEEKDDWPPPGCETLSMP